MSDPLLATIIMVVALTLIIFALSALTAVSEAIRPTPKPPRRKPYDWSNEQ